MAWRLATASAAATVALAASPVLLPRLDDTVSFKVVSDAPDGWLYDPWLVLPPVEVREAPRAQQMMVELQQMTGWSDRRLAVTLHCSHPTVSAISRGKSSASAGDLRQRLTEAFDVVDRIFLVAGRNPVETDRLLTSPPSKDAASAADLLATRDPAGAYLAALAVRRPARQSGLMRGSFPSRAGSATSEVAIE